MTDLVALPLSPDERALKAQCEDSVEALKEVPAMFWAAGKALGIINARRLYREEAPTFEDYTRQRWDMSDKHAYRLIDAAETRQNLIPAFAPTDLPGSEWVGRPLSGLPSPEAQQAAWQLVLDTAPGGHITQEHVKSVAISMQELLDTGAVEVDGEGKAVVSYAVDEGEGEMVPLAKALEVPITEETFERLQRHKQHIIDAVKAKAEREKRVVVLGRWPIKRVGWAPQTGLLIQLDLDKEAHIRLRDCQDKRGIWHLTLTFKPEVNNEPEV